MVPLWVAAYSDFQNQFKLAAAVEPSVKRSDIGCVRNRHRNPINYSAEAAFASLLPAWDAFVAGLPDPDQASSLRLMLNKAAGTVNVERDGVVGEVVAYDPLSHHLTTPSDQPPARVKVLRSGVQAKRTDGSKRTLVQTLVAAA